jgi:hypothetical protein
MTSIDWLIEELKLEGYDHTIQQAKEMHKQEIIKAYNVGNNDYANFSYVATSGENYYEVRFENKEE